MKEILFNSRHVIHIPSFRIVNLLCYGGQFGNITFINAKTKYRTLYLLCDVLRTSSGPNSVE